MQANAAAAAADDDGDDDLAAIPPPGGLRVGSICRLVKKSTSRAFNRAASAASDADAVGRFLDDPDLKNGLSFSSLPVFANARAGLWHVDLRDPRVHLCRYKSTDGHAAAGAGGGAGGGSFPLSRLNLGVAAAAAAAGASGGGGAVIVDATRKGKRFPDALSRTVPIWAAVVNRACRIWTTEDGEEKQKEEEKEEGEEEREVLFMPPWVPASEKSKIKGRVEGWARLLLSTGADLSAFAGELSERPLLPVWIARRGAERAMAGGPPVEVVHAEEGESKATTTPLYLFSASDPSARRASVSCGCCSSSSGGRESGTESSAPSHPSHGCFDLSFDYEPGGGDDEEGWSRGLSARLFWRHRGELLSSGPAGFEGAAEELARRERQGERGGAVGAAPGASRPAWTFVCGTRLAVGNAAAAAAAAAALCCSCPPSLSLGERGVAAAAVVSLGDGAGPPPSPPSSPLYFRAPVPPRKRLGLLEALPSVVAFASAHLLEGRTVLLASESGENENENENAAAAAAAVLLACFSAPAPRAELLRAFDGGGGGASPPLSRRPCGCPAPPPASRDEVRARIAAVCASASAVAGRPGGVTLCLSVGKEAAKQLLMFVSPPERPRGFPCQACRSGRPARIGAERAAASFDEGSKEEIEKKTKTRAPSGVEA